MNIFGWIFMAASWVAIISLAAFCFYRVISEPEEDL